MIKSLLIKKFKENSAGKIKKKGRRKIGLFNVSLAYINIKNLMLI